MQNNLNFIVYAHDVMVHDDIIKKKHFPRYWPFVRGIHRSSVNSPHKGQWRGALKFSLIRALNKWLSKQSWGWWFETPSRSLWRHCNGYWRKALIGTYTGDIIPASYYTCRCSLFIFVTYIRLMWFIFASKSECIINSYLLAPHTCKAELGYPLV